MSTTSDVAYDSRISDHFRFAKTLPRLSNFHWRHIAGDVKKLVGGCLKCQERRITIEKKLRGPEILKMPKGR